MNTSQTRRYEMLVRVRDFARAHADLFPKTTVAGKSFADVDAAVNELSRHAVSKMASDGAARDGAASRRAARTALVERVQAISRTARIAAATNAELGERLVLPRGRSDQALLTAGRLFFTDSTPFEATLTSHGLPKTFRADLNAAVERFDESLHKRNARRDTHAAAKASIDAALQAGFAAVQKLDVLVANLLHDDPVTMAVWERDRRVEYASRSKPGAPAPANTQGEPTAATEANVKAVA